MKTGERKRVLLVSILTLFATALISTSVAIGFLYRAALEEEKVRLDQIVASHARMIEAIVRFNTRYDDRWPDIAYKATLSQVRDAHKGVSGFGRTGEFRVGQRNGNRLEYVLRDRRPQSSAPIDTAFDDKRAEPMRRAVSGQTGIFIGPDHSGAVVLAAYAPVPSVKLGLVAMIDLAEVRQPFINAALWAGLVAFLLVLAGTAVFLGVVNPIIKKLEIREATFRRTFDQSPVGAAIVGLDLKYEKVNAAFARVLGYDQEELIGMESSEITHPDDIAEDRRRLEQLRRGTISSHQRDKRFIRKDGGVVWVRLSGSLVRNALGRPLFFLPILEDITARKKAEEKLHVMDLAMRSAVSGMGVSDRSNRLTFANQAFLDMWGAKDVSELLGQKTVLLWADADQAKTVGRLVREKGTHVTEMTGRRLSGETFPVHVSVSVLWDADGRPMGQVANMVDLTELKRAEEKIKSALREKVVLLSEIHHRVKNNMQVVSSLLNLQAGKLTDPGVKAIFQESQNRIRAMALIHENLYHTENMARIDLGAYLEKLAVNLLMTYDGVGRYGVNVRVSAPGITLGVDQALPCGLAVNELITNALKYAYPDGGPGEVLVEGTREADGRIRIAIKDEGRGMPPDVDWRGSETLGLPLVASLVEGQLRGTIEIAREPGTWVTLSFDETDPGEEQ